MDSTRIGYDLIVGEIPEGSRVLDLGCGDGALLEELQRRRSVEAFGVEISEEGVSMCVEKGLFCYQGDIDEGLSDYRDNSFDYVILNQTIQDTKRPEYVLREILRIGRKAIVSFPNFGYALTRFQLLCSGQMPQNRLFPYYWYESPNIHLFSIRDFEEYCNGHGYPVHKECHFSARRGGFSRAVRFFPNLYAEYGFFILDGERFQAGSD